MSLRSIKTLSISTIPLLMATYSLPVAAADEAGLMLEEVIVTATRQATGSQNTPLALTAISGDDLAKQGITSLTELAKLAPSLYVQEGVTPSSPRFSLRGISAQDVNFNGSSPVALYFDDVYQTTTYGLGAQLFDVGRVEVLRGPQGTLFGKNTTGGAISYFSVEPANVDEGYASFHLGEGDQSVRSIEGAVNAVLTDTLAVRVSVKSESKGDYMEDAYLSRSYGHQKSEAIRAQLKWTPSDETSVNFMVAADQGGGTAQVLHTYFLPNVCNFELPNNNGAAFSFCDVPFDNMGVPQLGGTPQPIPELSPDIASNTDVPNNEDFDSRSLTLRINQKIADWNLTSISHYKTGTYSLFEDTEGAPGDYLNLATKLRSQQIGQELRVASDASLPLSAVVGAYYQYDRLQDADSINSIKGTEFSDFNQASYYANRTTTYALFTTVTYKITDAVSLVGGVRKSDERKKIDGAVGYYGNGSIDWTADTVIPTSAEMAGAYDRLDLNNQEIKASPVTWDATINVKPMEDALLFARLAKSFRSGGFNLSTFIDPRDPNGVPPPDPAKIPPSLLPSYKPEYITSYEVGMKSEWFNHTLRLNTTAYYYKFADQQVLVFAGGEPVTQNAADSKVEGIELEIKALPSRAWELDGSVSYTKAEYGSYLTRITDSLTGENTTVDLVGKTLPQAPKWTATAGVAYIVDVSDSYDLRSSTYWQYRSEVFYTPDNDFGVRSAGVTTGSVRVELAPNTHKGVSVAAFIDNLTNRKPITYGFALPPVLNSVVYGVGRRYGMEMKYAW